MNRVSVQTDPGPKTHSRLIINKVDKEDSGNYTCSAPNTESSSIDVFVSPGNKNVIFKMNKYNILICPPNLLMHLNNTFVFLGERRAELSDNSGAALNQRFFVPWISLQILMPILVILMHSFTNSNCFTELIERFIIVFTIAGSVVKLTSHRMLFSIFSW